MPWQLEAMKDVLTCDKLSQASKRHLRLRFPNGETHVHKHVSCSEYIAVRGKLGRTETSKYPEGKEINRDSESSGERNRISP